MKCALRAELVLAALLASAGIGHAATITVDRLAGTSYALDAGQFEALASPTPLGSVTTSCGAPADGSRPILKCASDGIPDGRYNTGGQPWIDSADLGKLAWKLQFDKPVTALGFAVTDANDQRSSWWNVAVDGAQASLAAKVVDEGGPISWFTVLFDSPVSSAQLVFSTQGGDGFGIMHATAAPIPLPAAGLLLLGAVSALGAVRRVRRRTSEPGR